MAALESTLAFLQRPENYPQPCARVETVETHMSWVFLTERHAYKLKKAVRYALLDFGSVAARRFYCEEEVRLNRRLAPDVYLEVVALAVDAHGRLALAGAGRAVDWLVKMRRLPAGCMLDALIASGAAQAGDMRRIAALLARFYRGCAPAGIDSAAYRRRFERDIEQNRVVLCRPGYGLPAAEIERLCATQRAWLARIAGLLDERVAAQRVVEGHGDLRAEHVCLEEPPVIIDCLEFSRDLRIADAADELAFLALECERLGARGLGEELLAVYGELADDLPDPGLLCFYRSVRAGVRARIAIAHLDEERFRHSVKWQRRALEYLQLAQEHAQAGHATPVSPAAAR